MIPKPIHTVQPQRAQLPREDTALLLQLVAATGKKREALHEQLSLRVDSLFRNAGHAKALQAPAFAERMSERAIILKAVLRECQRLSQADVKALE